MHARLSRFAGLPPERIDETIEEFEKRQLPELRRQPGYQGVMVMLNRSSGQAAALTLWESEEDMRESERVADQVREAAMALGRPKREPVIDRYEVVMRQ